MQPGDIVLYDKGDGVVIGIAHELTSRNVKVSADSINFSLVKPDEVVEIIPATLLTRKIMYKTRKYNKGNMSLEQLSADYNWER
jgi:hypothetical protein